MKIPSTNLDIHRFRCHDQLKGVIEHVALLETNLQTKVDYDKADNVFVNEDYQQVIMSRPNEDDL